MFKALYQKLAKKNRGFTLIELIVVIAILGILIAILVPSMIGFVDGAKETSVKAEAKTVFTATQAYITDKVLVKGQTNDLATEAADWKKILGDAKLCDTSKLTSGASLSDLVVSSDGVTITKFEYKANGYTVTFPEGTVSK